MKNLYNSRLCGLLLFALLAPVVYVLNPTLFPTLLAFCHTTHFFAPLVADLVLSACILMISDVCLPVPTAFVPYPLCLCTPLLGPHNIVQIDPFS